MQGRSRIAGPVWHSVSMTWGVAGKLLEWPASHSPGHPEHHPKENAGPHKAGLPATQK